MNVSWKRVRCSCVLLPNIEDGINNYIGYGIAPGGFIRAVLENDLYEAVCRADAQSMATIRVIVLHVHNCLPANSWGSKGAVDEFLKLKNDEEWDRAALR